MKKLMKLRAANDQLLKQIHGLDHNYTETVVQYLRGALSKDPYAVEHAISDLLTTLIDAYQAGHRVSSFFSDDPQTAADNILKELPRASVSYHFAIFWPLIMFLLIESIFLMFISQDRQLTAGNIALAGANVFIMIPISYGRGIFFNKIARKTVLTWLAALVAIFFAPALIDYFSHGLLDLAISAITSGIQPRLRCLQSRDGAVVSVCCPCVSSMDRHLADSRTRTFPPRLSDNGHLWHHRNRGGPLHRRFFVSSHLKYDAKDAVDALLYLNS